MTAVLIVTFVVVPLLELYVVSRVGHLIGFVPTLLLLLFESLLGGWVIRREGSRAWRALRGALGTGRLPDRELADAALILVGGTLLLTPGFLTDVVGFFFILPLTRPLARRLLLGVISRRLFGPGVGAFGRARLGKIGTQRRPPGSRGYDDGRSVIEGEIVDD